MNQIIILLTQTVPEGRVFGLDSQTLIQIGVQLFNAVLLAAALSFILYKPVKEFMKKRSEKIRSGIDNAEATMAKARELIANYESKIEDINKERVEILEAAHLKAKAESKAILDEARKEANDIKLRSMEAAARDKERLQEELRLYVIELSSAMAEKFVAERIDDESRARYFEEMMGQLEEATWPK